MHMLERFDGTSQNLLQQFFRKVAMFSAFAALVSVLQTRGFGMLGILLQMQFLVGGLFSIFIATCLRQAIAADRLTYWDEAVAFSGLAMLSHIGARLIIPLT